NTNLSDMEKSLTKIKNRTEEVNLSAQQGFRQTASSAEIEFEKVVSAYERVGIARSKALQMALNAQIEEAKIQYKKMKKDADAAAS
ncbi:hypothetical protein, partial [Lactococcus petauri]|uniref:hypothetical protein n=1 Tax=Lactococcus petauri TaxID=1940789 RepID=UPI0021F0E345